jgi:hypothetical protein
LDKQGQLPEDIREHVAECFECKVELMEVIELMGAIGLPADEPYPFFGLRRFDNPPK